MELVQVKSTSQHKGVPTISINKIGVMRLSSIVKDALKLKATDKVGFYHEKGFPKNWFLKINDEDITLRDADTKKTALLANSISVANQILSSCGYTKKATMRIALKPIETDLYAILTASSKGE